MKLTIIKILYKKKKILCLVCCRLGSKGVPNKNLRKFHGKPILYWLSKELRKSNLFDSWILSTDSKKIAELGKKLGFYIPGLRPKSLSTGKTNVFDVHRYIFQKMNLNDKNSIVCVINNNPFISAKMINKTYKKFIQFKKKFIVHLAHQVGSDQIYYRQCVNIKKTLVHLFKKDLINSKINRNELNKIYVNLGDIRWSKLKYLENFKKYNQNIAKNGNKFIFINKEDYVDINSMRDFKIAEYLFNKTHD